MKPSLRHRRRMKKIIKDFEKEESDNKPVALRRVLVTAAVVIAIVVSTSVFASADIFKLFQRLISYSPEYIDITLSKDYTQRLIDETAAWEHGTVYVPGLIPDGYALDELHVFGSFITIEYFNQEGNFFIYTMQILGDDMIFSTDTEGAIIKNLRVNGYDAIYIENDRHRNLFYNTNEHHFSFSSNALGEKELVRIAENLENIDKLRKS